MTTAVASSPLGVLCPIDVLVMYHLFNNALYCVCVLQLMLAEPHLQAYLVAPTL